ncbi:hypothetical protein [Streptomyces sp. ICBB 8177]|uniref:hypothetical protein n=1 Tax=Streptomyces sp. ICBB 8177 TaxID=563922 RepID=UPI000D67A623|nr:hypothetical protein [Streptomyces sp. ICBB 8177]PWI42052.1 hypothetical protein CK485_25150 [Streptomyces sp. ICBB 8177]
MLTATVCVALSGAGLAVALLTAWRRRFLRAVRVAAVSLLPVGLYLAGLITMFRKIGEAVGDWAAGLVLKPSVWLGFAVLALAVLLYLIARLASGRSGRRAERRAAAGAGTGTAVEPAARPGPRQVEAKRAKAGKGGSSEFDDIEEILRKHGI